MTKSSINKLRRRFILMSFIAFLSVMLLMGGMIFLINYQVSDTQIKNTLDYIVENNGDISEKDHFRRDGDDSAPEDSFSKMWTEMFNTGLDSSPEFRFATRYFSVFFSESGEVENVITSNIAAVSSDQAKKYGMKAFKDNQRYGRVDQYYYQLDSREDGTLVVFLDCSSHEKVSHRLFSIIVGLICIGALGMFIIVIFLSKRMIMPEIRSAERQKQFITNAGHELKTPLSVIKANTELDIMINGENEWNASTLRQTEHMTSMIHDLIMIARSDEAEKEEDLTDTDISQTVKDAVKNFESRAFQVEKTLEMKVTDGIIMKADQSKISQLVSLLIDNAIKYCDEKGRITVELSSKGKNIRFVVSNDYKDGAGLDCSKFFERFYRADESHNNSKGGYGIGLSIAETIVRKYRGTIKANWNGGIIHFICTFKSL